MALSGTAVAETPDWLEPIRRAGQGKIYRCGFPSSRDEEWRFTPVASDRSEAPGASTGSTGPAVTREQLEPFIFGHREWSTLVFVDGAYSDRAQLYRPPAAGRPGRQPGRCAASCGACSRSISAVTPPTR